MVLFFECLQELLLRVCCTRVHPGWKHWCSWLSTADLPWSWPWYLAWHDHLWKKLEHLILRNKHKAPWSVDPCLWIALSAKLAMYNINNTLLWLYCCAGIEPSPAHHLLAHPRVYSAVVRAGTSIIVPGPPIMQWLLVTRRCVGCL